MIIVLKSKINIALAGNPNCGKTTLFNALTGARQYVGNWAGVTVEKKEGKLNFEDKEIIVTDLPGTYSLSTYSIEEIAARDFIVEEKPDVVVNIVDASNIERNLYLSLQLIELGTPVVIALNMMDIVEKKGMKINVEKLSKSLGVPVVPITASKNKGTQEMLKRVVELSQGDTEYKPKDIMYNEKVEEEIKKVLESIEHNPKASKYDARWTAVKIVEGDREVLKKLELPIHEVEEKDKNELETMVAEGKYKIITDIIGQDIT